MVFVVRPGYRIGSRTIKRGSQVSNLFVSFRESSNLGEPSLFRFYVLDKINASLVPLLFNPFIKSDIAYSRPFRRHLCPFNWYQSLASHFRLHRLESKDVG
jgi:hypothetical protein